MKTDPAFRKYGGCIFNYAKALQRWSEAREVFSTSELRGDSGRGIIPQPHSVNLRQLDFRSLHATSRVCPAISRVSQSNESRFCVIMSREDMARQAHNLKVVSSNLAPATKIKPAVSMR